MRRSSPLLLSLALFVSCATTEERAEPTAPVEQETPTELARRVLHLDSVDERVERLGSVGDVVARAFRGAVLRDAGREGTLDPVTRAWLDRLRAASARAYKRDALRERVVRAVAERDEGHLPAVLAWLQSPLLQRVSDERAAVATSGGQAALGQAIGNMGNRPPDPQRLTMVRTLHEASGRVDVFLALSFDASSDLLRALGPHLPDTLTGEDQTDEQRSADREGFRTRVTRTLMLQDWYALRGLSDAELDEVRSFWITPPGRWYARARLHGLREATRAGAKEVARALAAEGEAPVP